MINPIKAVKDFFTINSMAKQIKQEGGMDFKTVAGWIKIIGYLFAGAGILLSYLDPAKTIAVTLFLSAIVKAVEAIAPLTRTTVDDDIIKAVKDEAKEHGLLR